MSTEKEQQKIPFFARLQVKYAMSYLAILALVLVAVWLDKLLGAAYVRVAVCLFFIANEGLSILENLGLMGVPLPPFLKNMLEAMKEKSGNGKAEGKT